MNLEIYSLLAVIVALAAFVQGTIGVGFALIVVPCLALLQPDLVPVSVLALMIPLNAFVVYREWGALDWHGAGWVAAGRVVGTFGGVAVLVLLSPSILKMAIGIATVAAVLVTILQPTFRPNSVAFLIAGLVTGVTETATGIGGPPLALVYQHHTGPALRATIAACFLLGEIISLAVFAAGGQLPTNAVWCALLLLPALAAGVVISQFAIRHVSGAWLRRCVLGFAVVSGCVLVWRGIV